METVGGAKGIDGGTASYPSRWSLSAVSRSSPGTSPRTGKSFAPPVVNLKPDS
jgi:hypothetical protein